MGVVTFCRPKWVTCMYRPASKPTGGKSFRGESGDGLCEILLQVLAPRSFFYVSIYALRCLAQMQEISVCSPSSMVNVANSLKRRTLPGSYCMSRWCSVFLKPLLLQLCSFLGHFSIAPQCCVVQNLPRGKMSKPKWKYRTGLLPSGIGAMLVTLSKTKILVLGFFNRSLTCPKPSCVTTKSTGAHESAGFLSTLHIFNDFLFSCCIWLNTTWNFLETVSYSSRSNAL